MKARVLIFLLFVLPFLLLSNPFSRDRSWRLEKIIRENTDNGGFIGLSGVDSLYYAVVNSTAIDSIANWNWHYWDDTWSFDGFKKYNYDTSGNITELDFGSIYNNVVSVSIKHCYYYDTANHLMHRNVLQYNSSSQEYESSSRNHYIYTGDVLTNVYNYYRGMANAYEKVTYTVDGSGRFITETCVHSPDSLTWTNNYVYTYSWDANDTSTGAQYSQYLAKYLPYYYMWDSMEFGMLSEKEILSYWNGTSYIIHLRDVFSYNPSGFITEKVRQFWNSSAWENGSRQMYSYDTNNNVDVVYWQNWNTGPQMWDEIVNRNTYIWGQVTANHDEVVVPELLSLSVYPNPFNGNVNISFESKINAPFKASIYNVKGQEIRTFYNNAKAVVWDGRDKKNNPVSNGIYFIKATQDGESVSQKVIRIK